jgi:glutamyl-Q tRNA(Asp) synthetase
MKHYRGRFAPTPSGPLHFGSLVAAVGSYLDARANGGQWLVRIDDLDPPRVAAGATEDILRTLEDFGLQWDGPVVYQGQRAEAYHAATHRLWRLDAIYPCGCSRKEIADAGVAGVEGFVYPGTCRDGLPQARKARGLRATTRGATVEFDDAVQGRVAQDLAREIGDFLIYRADGVYAYHLAVAVDDAEQGITHVVRGADLLYSTPRQIHLQHLLELPVPSYAHLPVVVDSAGEKLSKQTLAQPLDRERPLPALIAALRFLGQEAPADFERSSVADLWKWSIAHWQLDRVPRASTAGHGPNEIRN